MWSQSNIKTQLILTTKLFETDTTKSVEDAAYWVSSTSAIMYK